MYCRIWTRLNLIWKSKFNFVLGNVTTIKKMIYKQNSVTPIALTWFIFSYKMKACQFSVSKSGENNLLFPLWKTAALLFYRILNRTWFSRRTDEPPTRNFHRSNRTLRIFRRIRRKISETIGNLISSDENRGGRKFQQLARELTFAAVWRLNILEILEELKKFGA